MTSLSVPHIPRFLMPDHLHRHDLEHAFQENKEVLQKGPTSLQHSHSPSSAEDLDLESAIGDAFKQFAFLNPSEHPEEDPVPQTQKNGVHHDDSEPDRSIDLEAAVGNAFLELAQLMGRDNFEPLDKGLETEIHPEPDSPRTEEIEPATGHVPQSSVGPTLEKAHPNSGLTPQVAIEHENAVHPHLERDGSPETSRTPNVLETHKSPAQTESHASPRAELPEQAETHSDVPEVEVKQEEDAELDLEAAIGNAFKNLTEDLLANRSEPTESRNSPSPFEPNVTDHENAVEQSEALPVQTEHNPLQIQSEAHLAEPPKLPFESVAHREDDKLEDAIDQAFKSLTDEFEHLRKETEQHQQPEPQPEPQQAVDDDHILHEAIFASFSEIMGQEKRKSLVGSEPKDDHGLELSSLVQNVVQQISLDGGSLHTQELAIPKEMLQDLAQEVSHQVHQQEAIKKRPSLKEIPHIDDNILAHFQLEANKGDEKLDEPKQDEAGLKSALASAMRNVLQQTGGEDDMDGVAEKSESLEKLQMNEILQNAFNMAMQNPQELLTSLELNDESSTQNVGDESSSTLSTAAAIAALSVKEALSKHDAHSEEGMGEKPLSSSDGKALSIAETLALHRSSMANLPRRDYTATLGLEDSVREHHKVTSMSPQLSSILSSLSQHIQSGNQSQNLMLVIRQMTNALMLNKASSYTMSSATQQILHDLQNRPQEQEVFIHSLRKAKGFLSKDTTDEVKRRALSLIENVIGIVVGKTEDGQNIKNANASENPVTQVESPSLSQFYASAFSTLANFNSSRFRNGIGGEKLHVDSNEYKEKIRIENRERKKRWREENSERNKDNDLRSRVLKRANYMFGESQSAEKKVWVEDEFNKRRAKRIAKQKKEETDKAVDSQIFVDAGPEVKHASSIYSQDPKLVKRLTDFFKVVAEAGDEDDPQALMTATSAATAVAASDYATSQGISEGHIVQSAMSQILTNVLDATVRSGNFTRISFLAKGTPYQTQATSSSENKDMANRFSSILGLGIPESGEGKSAMEILRSPQKRFGMEFLSGDHKRTHPDNSSRLYVEKDKSSMSRIQYEIDQLRDSITTSTSGHLWGSATGLKMPLYKKPAACTLQDVHMQESQKKDVTTPALPAAASPFISNKVGLKSEPISGNGVSGGLKKPGSFQRPAFSKTSRGRSLGFPTLYSASFSQK